MCLLGITFYLGLRHQSYADGMQRHAPRAATTGTSFHSNMSHASTQSMSYPSNNHGASRRVFAKGGSKGASKSLTILSESRDVENLQCYNEGNPVPERLLRGGPVSNAPKPPTNDIDQSGFFRRRLWMAGPGDGTNLEQV